MLYLSELVHFDPYFVPTSLNHINWPQNAKLSAPFCKWTKQKHIKHTNFTFKDLHLELFFGTPNTWATFSAFLFLPLFYKANYFACVGVQRGNRNVPVLLLNYAQLQGNVPLCVLILLCTRHDIYSNKKTARIWYKFPSLTLISDTHQGSDRNKFYKNVGTCLSFDFDKMA